MIQRTSLVLHEDWLTLANLHTAEELFTLEEIRDFKKKLNVLENLPWASLEQRALAEKVFKLGYLAAHIEFPAT